MLIHILFGLLLLLLPLTGLILLFVQFARRAWGKRYRYRYHPQAVISRIGTNAYVPKQRRPAW